MLRGVGLAVCLIGCGFDPGRPGAPDDAMGMGDGSDADAPIDSPDGGGGGGPGQPGYVQGQGGTNNGSHADVELDFPFAQVAGNFNIVVVSYGASNESVMSVTDVKGNTYTAANTRISAGFVQQIYWASNIAAGTNRVIAMAAGSVPSPTLRIFEYSGLEASSPVDGAEEASGVSNRPSAGPVNTNHQRDLLFAAVVAVDSTGPGPGFTQRLLGNGDIVEDRFVTMKGAYTAEAMANSASNWVMQVVAFKVAP